MEEELAVIQRSDCYKQFLQFSHESGMKAAFLEAHADSKRQQLLVAFDELLRGILHERRDILLDMVEKNRSKKKGSFLHEDCVRVFDECTARYDDYQRRAIVRQLQERTDLQGFCRAYSCAEDRVARIVASQLLRWFSEKKKEAKRIRKEKGFSYYAPIASVYNIDLGYFLKRASHDKFAVAASDAEFLAWSTAYLRQQ